MGLAIVLQWRGLWNLLDMYIYRNWIDKLAMSIMAFSYLSLTRTTVSLMTTPFILQRDECVKPFTTESTAEPITVSLLARYGLDYLLTEIIECWVLVIAWRGVEAFFDEQIYPDDKFRSVIAQATSGHAFFFLLMLIQIPLASFMNRQTFILRVIVDAFMNITMFVISVLLWKFYSDSMDYFFLTDDNAFKLFVSGHFSIFFASIILSTLTLIGGPAPNQLDGELRGESDGGSSNWCCYFEMNYFRAICLVNILIISKL
jgi:hypothetical protein